MRMLADFVTSIAALFVDDGNLALTVVLVLAVTAFAANTPWFDEGTVGAGLVVAIALALLVNVLRSARNEG